jgi:hypothetical protein
LTDHAPASHTWVAVALAFMIGRRRSSRQAIEAQVELLARSA